MNKLLRRVVSMSLASALIMSASTAALAAETDDTTEGTQANSHGWIVDENGDVINDYVTRATGDFTDPDDIDENGSENTINSAEDYKEFAGIKENRRMRKAAAAALPDSVDNTENENSVYFPPIGDQGYIGSCVAWATTYYQYTYTINKARGIPTTRENTYSPMWTYNLCNYGKDNGTSENKAYEVLKAMGAATVTEVPEKYYSDPEENYLSWHAENDIWEHAAHNRMIDYSYFRTTVNYDGHIYELDYPVSPDGTPVTDAKDPDLDALKTALSNGSLVCVSTAFSSWDKKIIKRSDDPNVDNSHAGEIAAYQSKGRSGHKMTLVGYNDNIWIDVNNNDRIDNGEMGAFKIANSWGLESGNDGFFWVAYDALNEVSAVPDYSNPSSRFTIFCNVSVMTADDTDRCSGVFLKYTLNTANRYDTKLYISAKGKNNNEYYSSADFPHKLSYYTSLCKNDRNYSYNGRTGLGDGTMYIDLNNVVPGITPENIDDYNWEILLYGEFVDTPITIKELKFVYPENNMEYDVLGDTPVTINKSTKTYNVSDVVLDGELKAKISASVDGNSTLSAPGIADIKAKAIGGAAPYQYRFEMAHNGETTFLSDWSSESSVEKLLEDVGNHKFTVRIKDAEGTEAEAEIDKYVVNPSLGQLNCNANNIYKGQTVTFRPTENYVSSLFGASDYKYTITNNGISTEYTANDDHSLTWTAAKTGLYTVKCELVYNSVKYGECSKTFSVSDNTVKIYYKGGFAAPYIHYGIDGKNWTTAPGAAMNRDDSVPGYTHSYTIDLGSGSNVQVCFNNGYNSWDNNNGSNYCFEKGTYTFNYGTITPYDDNQLKASLTLSSREIIRGESVDVTCDAAGGTAPYQYKFAYVYSGSEFVFKDYSDSNTAVFTPDMMGDYTIKVYVMDAEGKTTEVTDTIVFNEPFIKNINTNKPTASAGETVKVSMDVAFPFTMMEYRYTVSNGDSITSLSVNSDYSASWTPAEAGTYKITAYLLRNGSVLSSSSIEYTVTDAPLNAVVIYYKGYSTPNIHYQVGSGAWTAVPGVAMEASNEVPGYTHKYTIDLGSADHANVCFNDGHGNWDSRNGANYYFTKGTYKYSNGTITAM